MLKFNSFFIRSEFLKIEVIITYSGWKNHIKEIKGILTKITENVSRELNLKKFKERLSLSILLTDDSEIRQLNLKYRDKDKPTNVLSFPSEEIHVEEFEENSLIDSYLGDIAMSYDTIFKESEINKITFINHFAHISLHGILHIFGFRHDENIEAEVMEELEIKILKSLGIESPYK